MMHRYGSSQIRLSFPKRNENCLPLSRRIEVQLVGQNSMCSRIMAFRFYCPFWRAGLFQYGTRSVGFMFQHGIVFNGRVAK